MKHWRKYQVKKNVDQLKIGRASCRERAIDKGLRKVYKQGKRGGNNFGMNKGGMIDMRKTGMFYGGMARKK